MTGASSARARSAAGASAACFRDEIRRCPEGRIRDVADAVDSPQRLADNLAVARRLLEHVPPIPRPVMGRDEAHTGDM